MGESRRAVIPFARCEVDNRTACILLALGLNIKIIEMKRLPAAYVKEQMRVPPQNLNQLGTVEVILGCR
jgi:hypothetical protein